MKTLKNPFNKQVLSSLGEGEEIPYDELRTNETNKIDRKCDCGEELFYKLSTGCYKCPDCGKAYTPTGELLDRYKR